MTLHPIFRDYHREYLPPQGDPVRRWTDLTEPALIRAVVAAVIGVAAALGLVLPFDLPAIAEAGIGVLAVLIPLLQGITTRAAVVSPATHTRELVAATGRHAAPTQEGTP